MKKLMFRIPNISVSMCGEGQQYSEMTYLEVRLSEGTEITYSHDS
jgi:hypothetical protein